MSLKDALNYPLEKRIAIIFDYDLTMTKEFQQVPYLADNFRAIQKEYDGKEIVNPKTGEKITLSIKEPADYFKLSDLWGEPHNGVGYVQQMLYDARKGILKNFTEEGLREAGAKVQLSPGLPEFLKKLRKEWKDKCSISYFIVSVGLEPIIEGSSIAKSGQIDEIFATKLYKLDEFWKGKKNGGTYDAVSEIVTPFNKTGYAIEIAKGGRAHLNRVMKHDSYMFDYRNMFVLGDGTSDISQFAYARRKGSMIIGVYKHDSVEAFDNIRTNKLIQDRCNAIKPRDYREGSDLWNCINQGIKVKLERSCTFDPEYIDMYRKKKIRNLKIRNFVSSHLKRCSYCNGLLDLSISQPDNSE
ncbi:MAG: hypothetical protein WC852_06515 [Candidatus Nanoarchaeia archaeon]|jgi:hypothetical protein